MKKERALFHQELILKEVEEVRSAVAQFARTGEVEETLPELRHRRQRAGNRLHALKDIRNSLTPLQRKPFLSPRQRQRRQEKLEVILQDIEMSRRPAQVGSPQENAEECKKTFTQIPQTL